MAAAGGGGGGGGGGDSEADIGPTVVMDIGSERCRAGFSHQDRPSLVMPSVVGRPKLPFKGGTHASNGVRPKPPELGPNIPHVGTPTLKAVEQELVRPTIPEVVVGEEAVSRRGELRLRYPVEWGVVTGWDDLQTLWDHVLHRHLACRADTSPLVMLESCPVNPRANRERLTELAFETFRIPAFYLDPSASAVMRAVGRATGVVIDIGPSDIRVVPVYEGYKLAYAVMKCDFGGNAFTDYLHTLLAHSGVSLSPYGTREARAMKERLAYVAQDYQQELDTFTVSQNKTFLLPNGDGVTLGAERFQCMEPLFQPRLMGREMAGLAERVVLTVDRCHADIRGQLLDNVVLAGGGSLLPGLASRLQQEIDRELRGRPDTLVPHVQVIAPPERDLLAWKGGSLLASSPAFLDMCISMEEYDEYGPCMVHRKCF